MHAACVASALDSSVLRYPAAMSLNIKHTHLYNRRSESSKVTRLWRSPYMSCLRSG